MKIAVTGANGFIGRYVVAELLNYPVEVIPLIRSSTSNLPASLQKKAVSLDIHNATADTFQFIGAPDVLIHLAWAGLPNYKSLHHFETELPDQYKFLRTLIDAGLKTLVVTGTCFEYGMQSGALSEDMTTAPDNSYGFAKDTLRRQLQFLQEKVNFSLVWARLFYLYGEGQAENSLFPQLKRAIQNHDSCFNMSGGEQLRDYLTVEQVAKYLCALAYCEKNIGMVNVSSGKPISIRALVENWIQESSSQINLNLGYYPYPDYEPMAFWGDIRKLNIYVHQE